MLNIVSGVPKLDEKRKRYIGASKMSGLKMQLKVHLQATNGITLQ